MSENRDTGFETVKKNVNKLKEPEDYQVILLNDDFTSMDFVVEVLMYVFHKSEEDALQIMMHVHKSGRGLAGIYPWDIAVTKRDAVHSLAKESEYPLKCLVEKV